MAGPEAELMETGYDVGRALDERLIRRNLDTGPTEAESDSYVRRATEEARAFMTARWVEVRAVAEALLEHGRLEHEQAAQIAEAAHGPA